VIRKLRMSHQVSGSVMVALVWTAAFLFALDGTVGEADPRQAAAYTNKVDGTVLLLVHAGSSTMGSTEEQIQDAIREARQVHEESYQDELELGLLYELPAHIVDLPAYYIGRTEVTNAQFRNFVESTGYDAGEDWKKSAAEWGDSAPVVYVSWYDANSYCKWAGLRLPTEAEWEKAARGVDALIFSWGNRWDGAMCRSSVGVIWGAILGPSPCGSFPEAVAPYGSLDVAGNVLEWCSSTFDPYPAGRNTCGDEELRVQRGGSWLSTSPLELRTTYRRRDYPANKLADLGFRCAASTTGVGE